MAEALPDLLIDSREPKERTDKIQALFAKNKRTTRIETLPTDYMLPGKPGWAIEYKEASDFIHTWVGERLGEQLETLKMLEQADYQPAIMVVGSFAKALSVRRGRMNPLSIGHMLLAIQTKWKIPVFRIDNEWMVPYSLNYLAAGTSGERKPIPFRHGAKKTETPEEQAIYVLQGFPGVGPVASEKVRSVTSNLADFIGKVLETGTIGPTGLTPKQLRDAKTVLNENWRKEK